MKIGEYKINFNEINEEEIKYLLLSNHTEKLDFLNLKINNNGTVKDNYNKIEKIMGVFYGNIPTFSKPIFILKDSKDRLLLEIDINQSKEKPTKNISNLKYIPTFIIQKNYNEKNTWKFKVINKKDFQFGENTNSNIVSSSISQFFHSDIVNQKIKKIDKVSFQNVNNITFGLKSDNDFSLLNFTPICFSGIY
jgi:hypothetical protein